MGKIARAITSSSKSNGHFCNFHRVKAGECFGARMEPGRYEERCRLGPSGSSKTKKPIGIPLSKTAMDVLREEEGKHEMFVFTYEGVPVGSVKTAWGKALKRAGLGTWEKKGKGKVFKPNFKWHDLRHTWATWHVQSGTPLEVLQKLGGWSDFKMVLRYAHFAPEYLAGYADNSVPYARQIARVS